MKVPASFAAAIGTFTSPRKFVEDASAQVTLREDAGVYTVNATMAGSEPAAVAIIVLSDYDQIPRFIPDVHRQPRDRAGTIVAAETQLDRSDVGPAFAVRAGMRIGVLTGGGDAPGLNAAIRAVVKSAGNHGAETIGVEDGFAGLIDATHWRQLTPKDVPGILRLGGTILGTTNRRNPFAYPTPTGGVVDNSARCVETFHRLELDALIVIGGDGTLAIANEFCKRGVPIVCVPKTIDNDIAETVSSFGFDTAVSFATDAIDRLHTTAEAHHRVMVVEVMGRYAGWIALHAGVAGGADVILIPEIPHDLDKVAQHILAREELGARFSIVVAAEGAIAVGAGYTIRQQGSASAAERLGGIGERLVADLERKTKKETRSVMLGHLQRGGVPTSADRLLATRFGARALELALEQKWGTMVALQPPEIVAVPLANVVGRVRTVPPDCDLIHAARAVGVAFGN